MRILLDTNIFLWSLIDDPRLTISAKRFFLDSDNILHLSIASLWEIFIKLGTGKLTISDKNPAAFLEGQIRRNAIRLMAINFEHTAYLLQLPALHKDPFDRIIIAQALHDDLPIISSDPIFAAYGVRNLF